LKKNTKKKNIFLVILFWFIALIAIIAVFMIATVSYLSKPVTDKQNSYSQKIKVPQGTTLREVGNVLQQNKLIKSSDLLYFAARFNLFREDNPFYLKSGVYTVRSDMSLKEIYDLLQSGEQEYISVSIPEGLTISKIAQIVENKGICSAEDFKVSCSSSTLLDEYHIEADNFEGYLFPDTYFFTPDMKSDLVVKEMVQNFYRKISTIEQLNNADYQSLNKTVILASIIEREYRVESEAPLIASVFTNRLKYNIGLYSCATIEYIITELQGKEHPDRITYDDLKIDSPYNTYKWAGLPPGPISNPGLISLKAAANPAKTNYFYFVLTNSEVGSHTFSETFDQHKAAESIKSYVSK